WRPSTAPRASLRRKTEAARNRVSRKARSATLQRRASRIAFPTGRRRERQMHLHMSLQQLVITLVVVVLIFRDRHIRGLRENGAQLARELNDAVQRRMPVYSAETTRGKEAEFIRDRLPK